MQKWEYQRRMIGAGYQFEKVLNELGEQGWEVVSIFPSYKGDLQGETGPFDFTVDDSSSLYVYFKRAKP